jgi:hypothetical protein
MVEREEPGMPIVTSRANPTSSPSSPDVENHLHSSSTLLSSSLRTYDDDREGWGGFPMAVSPQSDGSTPNLDDGSCKNKRATELRQIAPWNSVAAADDSCAHVSRESSSLDDHPSPGSSEAPSSSFSSYRTSAEGTGDNQELTRTMIQELKPPKNDDVHDVDEWEDDADIQNGDGSRGDREASQDGPPRTVFIPPPMAPYAQLYYRPGEDKMVALLIVGSGSSGSQQVTMASAALTADADATTTMSRKVKGDEDEAYRALAHQRRKHNKTNDLSVQGSVAYSHNMFTGTIGFTGGVNRDDGVENLEPELDGLEVSSGQHRRSSTFRKDISNDPDEVEDELTYSRSSASGLSTAFSMDTLANLSSANSYTSSSIPSTGRSINHSSSSSCSKGIHTSGGISSSDSESTVVMYNNASRCRRDPQEIVWMDEAWLADCDSRTAPSWNNDRLALLHHVASWRDGFAEGSEDVDLDLDDAMSGDSCGKLLLRSVAICKSKIKTSGGVMSHNPGGRNLSPKLSYASSSLSSPKSASLSSSSSVGFLSGKMYDYAKL